MGTNVFLRQGARWLKILAQSLAVALLLLWIGDWGVFRIRSAHGGGFATIQVQEYLSTPLKNGRPELDYLRAEPVLCARAIFPHGGSSPCWWVRRHTTVWE